MDRRTRVFVIALALAIAAVSTTGVAVATSRYIDGQGMLAACIAPNGALRAVGPAAGCRQGEESASWQTGRSAADLVPMTFHIDLPGNGSCGNGWGCDNTRERTEASHHHAIDTSGYPAGTQWIIEGAFYYPLGSEFCARLREIDTGAIAGQQCLSEPRPSDHAAATPWDANQIEVVGQMRFDVELEDGRYFLETRSVALADGGPGYGGWTGATRLVGTFRP